MRAADTHAAHLFRRLGGRVGEYFAFQWHITDQCDQRCRHCYIYAGNDADGQKSMSWTDMQTVLANMQDFGRRFNRSPYLYLTGGDPLLHEHFWDLASELQRLDIPYTILGNPFHLTPEVCSHLKETGCTRYQLSLDGLEQTHDWMRKPGSFNATLRALPMLKDAGIRTIAMMTVSSVNAAQTVPLMEFLADKSVDLFAFARFCNSADAGGNGLDPLEYRTLLQNTRQAARRLRDDGSAMELSLKDHLFTLLDWEEGTFEIPANVREDLIYDGCHCGNTHLTILPDGTVCACRRVNSPVGNAVHDSLAEIWTGEAMERYRQFDKFSKCGRCELLAWCRGCPAVAAASSGGDFYASDPQCWKEDAECGQSR